MTVKLQMGRRDLFIVKELAKGNMEWEELTYEDKMAMYACPYDITDSVPEEKVREFESEMALKGEFGVSGIGREVARMMKRKAIGEQ